MDKITLEMDRRTALIVALCCYGAHAFWHEAGEKFSEKFGIDLASDFNGTDAEMLAQIGCKLQDMLRNTGQLILNKTEEYGDEYDLYSQLFINDITEN